MTQASTLSAAVVFLATAFGAAQTPSATAPIPAQLTTATSAFLGNAGSVFGNDSFAVYNSAYGSLRHQASYHLTATPSEADLLFELSVQSTSPGVAFGNSTPSSAFIHLVIYDRSTHALLWTLDEPIAVALRKQSIQNNIDAATKKLADDLKALAHTKLP